MNAAAEWAYTLFLSTGYSINKFGKVCGINGLQLKRWHEGEAEPYWKSIKKIGLAMGVSVPDDVKSVAMETQAAHGLKKIKEKKKEESFASLPMLDPKKRYCTKSNCEWINFERKCNMPVCMKGV